jgi:arabinogalactan endo-1,4-beta-galactosidase
MPVANGRGKGVYWWEPGNHAARGFFDAGGRTMPVFGVFHRYTRPIRRSGGQ